MLEGLISTQMSRLWKITSASELFLRSLLSRTRDSVIPMFWLHYLHQSKECLRYHESPEWRVSGPLPDLCEPCGQVCPGNQTLGPMGMDQDMGVAGMTVNLEAMDMEGPETMVAVRVVRTDTQEEITETIYGN